MLTQGPWSALELAGELLLTRREVEEHLVHLQRSLGKDLLITPAQCRACGYEFNKRRRLDAPGRCPVCRGQRIDGPWFEKRS
ncbi:MAG: transcriptional regulator [Deltaproteobacteria bacterium]|nr:transcriptional regulator [Deltaproteobacteria bacterium]